LVFFSPSREKSSISHALKILLSWVGGRREKEKEREGENILQLKTNFCFVTTCDSNVGTILVLASERCALQTQIGLKNWFSNSMAH